MRYNSPLKIPKNEELEVPESTLTQFSNSKETCYNDDELEGILGIEEDKKDNNGYGLLSWDFMDWEEEAPNVEDGVLFYNNNNKFEEESHQYCHSSSNVIKKESFGFFDAGEDDDDDSKASLNLNLNLNYQQVLDAWSDRGPLLANEYSLSMGSNGYYMGEVPVMEEDRTRREASVMRYKEKRHTRLFSKKIRYQVRKLNADKRPRLKGRFVKRCSS